MSRVVVGFCVVVAVVGGGRTARAEEPAGGAVVREPAAAPCPPATLVDVAAEQRAFELEMELFARRWEVTQRLVAERETRAFEEAEARYLRFSELTSKLAADAAAEAEREFDAAVALFVKKRELTLSLSLAPKSPAPSAPGFAPIQPPAR